jgi:hypothetical protein
LAGRRTGCALSGTMTEELMQLVDWLAANAVTHVAMESTGVS